MQRTPTLLLVLALTTVAWGAAPANYTVVYRIHKNPSDPSSPLTFTIEMDLARWATLNNSIGWQIAAITIRQYSSGTVVNTWTDSAPRCPTSDGLWWTTNADPNNPQLSEFTLPPHMIGVAACSVPNGAALDYDYAGVPPTTNGGPYAVTTYLDYTLQVEGDPNAEDGECKPVDTTPN